MNQAYSIAKEISAKAAMQGKQQADKKARSSVLHQAIKFSSKTCHQIKVLASYGHIGNKIFTK